VVVVAAYTFLVTYGIGKAIDKLMGFRASAEEELTGLDQTVHAESAYDHGVLGATVHPASAPAARKVAP
jgi:Amt family ammonium transporter